MDLQRIDDLGLPKLDLPSSLQLGTAETALKPTGTSFEAVMQESVNQLNAMQKKSADLGNRLAAGENVELHDVIIASQEADVAMRLAVQLRNKALEAYREIIRMPV
jgi:flagellar hook-basal body complex protein FliE